MLRRLPRVTITWTAAGELAPWISRKGTVVAEAGVSERLLSALPNRGLHLTYVLWA